MDSPFFENNVLFLQLQITLQLRFTANRASAALRALGIDFLVVIFVCDPKNVRVLQTQTLVKKLILLSQPRSSCASAVFRHGVLTLSKRRLEKLW